MKKKPIYIIRPDDTKKMLLQPPKIIKNIPRNFTNIINPHKKIRFPDAAKLLYKKILQLSSRKLFTLKGIGHILVLKSRKVKPHTVR